MIKIMSTEGKIKTVNFMEKNTCVVKKYKLYKYCFIKYLYSII
jgi:hypothetical protein